MEKNGRLHEENRVTSLDDAWDVMWHSLTGAYATPEVALASVRAMPEQIAAKPELAENDPYTYYTARLMTATWEIFEAWAQQQAPKLPVLHQAHQDFVGIMKEAAQPNIEIMRLPFEKQSYALVGMLGALFLRHHNPSYLVVPTKPMLHIPGGINGIPYYQLFGATEGDLHPVRVRYRVKNESSNDRPHALWSIPMQYVVSSAARQVQSIYASLRARPPHQQGPDKHWRDASLDLTAELLAKEASGQSLHSDEAAFLDNAFEVALDYLAIYLDRKQRRSAKRQK